MQRCLDEMNTVVVPVADMSIAKDFPALRQAFFCRPAEVVGPELVGCRWVKRQSDGSLLWGVIVETEAYSQDDPACHGYRRRSPQNETLFGVPGQLQLSFAIDVRLNQIPEEWHQVVVRFRRTNSIRDGDRERRFWQLC